MHIADQIIYPDQPKILSFLDFALTPLRVAFQGRTYDCSIKKMSVTTAVHHMALRIIAGLIALLILPLTVSALAIKWSCMEELELRFEKAKRLSDEHPASQERHDFNQLLDTDEIMVFALEALGMSRESGHPLVSASDIHPTINLDTRKIQYYRYFDGSNAEELSTWEKELESTLIEIRSFTIREAWAKIHVGTGISLFYVFDHENKLRAVDSERLAYSQEPLYTNLAEKMDQVDVFTIITPAVGARERQQQ